MVRVHTPILYGNETRTKIMADLIMRSHRQSSKSSYMNTSGTSYLVHLNFHMFCSSSGLRLHLAVSYNASRHSRSICGEGYLLVGNAINVLHDHDHINVFVVVVTDK